MRKKTLPFFIPIFFGVVCIIVCFVCTACGCKLRDCSSYATRISLRFGSDRFFREGVYRIELIGKNLSLDCTATLDQNRRISIDEYSSSKIMTSCNSRAGSYIQFILRKNKNNAIQETMIVYHFEELDETTITITLNSRLLFMSKLSLKPFISFPNGSVCGPKCLQMRSDVIID